MENSLDLAPARLKAENSFELAAKRRSQIIWRIDAGFGTDDKLRWLLGRDYQVLAKGHSGQRAKSLAKQVQRWCAYGDARQGSVPTPVDFGREVKVVVKRRMKKGKFLHSFYLTTLQLPSNSRLLALYDQRGAMEVEPFRNDKQGLHLSSRRKRGFQGYGPKRIVRDLLAMEGRIHFDTGKLEKVELSTRHPHADELLDCLVRYVKSY